MTWGFLRRGKSARPPAARVAAPEVPKIPAGFDGVRFRTARPRRIFFVGLGSQGFKVAIALHRSGHQLVGICDLSEARREMAREMFPGAETTGELGAFAGLAPDVSVIATMAGSRVGLIRALADAGCRRFFCEKPIVNSARDAADLERLVAERGLAVSVNHFRHWLPDYADCREIIQGGGLGALRHVEARFKPKGLGHMGTHFVAAVLALTGARVVRVESALIETAEAGFDKGGYQDFNGRMECRLSNGATMTAASASHPFGGRADFISLHFDSGELHILDHLQTIVVRDYRTASDSERALRVPWMDPPDWAEAFSQVLETALDDLVEGRRDRNLEIALESVRAVIAAQVAFQRGAPVDLPLPEDTPTPFNFS